MREGVGVDGAWEGEIQPRGVAEPACPQRSQRTHRARHTCPGAASGRPSLRPGHSAARHRWVAARSLREAERRRWRQALRPEAGMRLADEASCEQLGRKARPHRRTEGTSQGFSPKYFI